MSIEATAREFFDACETGKGWEVCQQWCHSDASFDCQADALADTATMEGLRPSVQKSTTEAAG